MQKKYLIRKNKDYRRVYKRGVSLANSHLVIFKLKNSSDNKRFGFSVSKKIGKAVYRNLIRRRFKNACRTCDDLFADGYDYVLIARKGIKRINYAQLVQSLEKLACRIRAVDNKEYRKK